ncbi:MAG: acyl-ACP--UDP-N-acetylglucosamine O-acyltransferase [Alphaproteobacteria bacterium]|nr:acyl-ACP--UDP-N-acetylglucosamine O-acyltransferase [Alphaproteobacteria bacterium]
MSARIHPTAIVEDGAQLGDDCEIGAWCHIGKDAVIADRTRLMNNVTVLGHTEIGADCLVYPYAVLGGPPQDFKYKGEKTHLRIGNRNILREQVTMHAGTGVGRGETRVGDDGFFMVGAHIAHDCIVGNKVTMANHATLGGHSTVGEFAVIGGLAGVHQHSRVGRHAFIGGITAVVSDIIPYAIAHGAHAHLDGLNVIGLKRRGFDRATIKAMRAAYNELFHGEGVFATRLQRVEDAYSDVAPVREILDFIKAGTSRPLCHPHA